MEGHKFDGHAASGVSKFFWREDPKSDVDMIPLHLRSAAILAIEQMLQ